MLPAMAELMPPFAPDDLALVDLVDCPQVAVGFVQENRLEDVVFVRHRGRRGVVVHAELVLVVGAIEGHFNLLRIFGVRMRVIHGAEAAGFAIWTAGFVLGESDLAFFILGFGRRAELRVELGFVVALEVFTVRVGDGDIVIEPGPA